MGAELQALVFGLSLCMECGFKKIYIYSTSLLAVRVVIGLEENFDSIEHLICEAKELLASSNFLGIHHMSRLVNFATHCLTRFAFSYSSSSVWKEYGFFNWLKEVVITDRSAT